MKKNNYLLLVLAVSGLMVTVGELKAGRFGSLTISPASRLQGMLLEEAIANGTFKIQSGANNYEPLVLNPRHYLTKKGQFEAYEKALEKIQIEEKQEQRGQLKSYKGYFETR